MATPAESPPDLPPLTDAQMAGLAAMGWTPPPRQPGEGMRSWRSRCMRDRWAAVGRIPRSPGKATSSGEHVGGPPGEGYQLAGDVLAAVGAQVGRMTRAERRRAHREAAEVTVLAVQHPKSGATTRDRLAAAATSARIAGLTSKRAKPPTVLVMRGWGSPPVPAVQSGDGEAPPAAPTGPSAADPGAGGPGDAPAPKGAS